MSRKKYELSISILHDVRYPPIILSLHSFYPNIIGFYNSREYADKVKKCLERLIEKTDYINYAFDICKLTSYSLEFPGFKYKMILREFSMNGILRNSTTIAYYKNRDHAEAVKKNLEQLIKKEVK